MRTTIMEVDINKFNKNIDSIQKYVGDRQIMPVIKSNAYGTYINKNIDVINKFNIVAVATLDEAVELRNLGYKKEIFVLNQPCFLDIQNIIEYNVIIGLSEINFLKELIKINKKVRIHLEIETGMNRTGIRKDELLDFIDLIKKSNSIEVEGVYTHLSSADNDENYTNWQLKLFKEAVNIVNKNFNTIKYIHSSASNGLINYNDGISNLVRPGMIMYGYESTDGVKNKIHIEPICKLKTKVSYLKKVDKGTSISYSRKFISKSAMMVATIPVGYADGLRRELSNKGLVVINGQKVPIIGNICMNSCMIDVTNIKDVGIGTDVYIWDNDVRTLEDIAEECNTINYEILSSISYSVPRIYI